MRNKLVSRNLFKLKIVNGAIKISANEKRAFVQPPISAIQVNRSSVDRLNTCNFVSKLTSKLLNL